MFFIKKSEIINNSNNENFKKNIKKYIKYNRCCNNINCDHPKSQSNSFLHKKFKIFEESINQELNLKIIKLWAFFVKKNNKILETWHHHSNELSCLLYLNESNLGTNFENFNIKLKINCWLVWKGNLLHTPEPGLVKKDRIIIAGTLIQ
jgi:hypothetical protein